MNSRIIARKLLESFSPPRFVNPDHRDRLRRQLAAVTHETTAARAAASPPARRAGARVRLALAVAAAAVLAVIALLAFMPPHNLFARALEAASHFSMVHYRLTRRAIPNQWGVVFDPRQPLAANDEVWVHLSATGAPAEVRYESGLQVGDRFVRLIRAGEILTYKPAVRWAWRTSGGPAPFLRIGPMSILAKARSLDRSAYTVRREDGTIVAVATVAKSSQPAGRAPIRLTEMRTRRTFVFDAKTGLLRRARIEGLWRGGWLTLALIDRIQYQELDPALFRIDLPADVVWSKPSPEPAPRIAFGPPEDITRRFLRAWVAEDATTLRALGGGTPYDELLSPRRTGSPAPVAVVSVGASERDPDGIYPGVWVPYAVRFPDGRVKRHRLALKQRPDGAWFVDGGV